MCIVLQPQFRQLAEEAKAAFIYSRIDYLDESVIDELAWQLHVDWYDASADITIKRQLIKNAIKVHQLRGTPAAVEEVIQAYFGDGEVQEWFDYGGQPYMFKVVTRNPSVTGEQAEQFMKVLDTVKNTRSHLEEIIIALSGDMNFYFAGVVQTGDFLEIRQVV